jgi:hypothetical protein
MKKVIIALCLFFASFTANAGPYLELGIGWLRDVPVQAEREVYVEDELHVRLEDSATVRIDSPFTRLTFGYRWKSTNLHLEYRQMGIIGDDDQSIKSIELYKRWELDW